MILRTTLRGRPLVVSLKDASCSVASGDHHVVAWDRGGRLYSVYREGHTYRRGLNGRVLHKWQTDEGRRRRVWLDRDAADHLLDECAAFAAGALDAIGPRLVMKAGSARQSSESELDGLRAAAGFDASQAAADAVRFHAVYRPIGILPPDQYLALVLQATEGCSFGSCTFCRLYAEPYRVKSVEEFRGHMRQVVEYLGPSILLRRRSVFLGAANALAVPMPRLIELLSLIASELPPPRRPVHAFVDGFTGQRKSASDYEDLRALGLERVYIGLESGHDPLLELVGKPASREDAVATVRAIKEADVGVAVIVMVGLGGDRFAAAHVADTIEALRAMPLGPGDLVYFSELVVHEGSGYETTVANRSIRPLTPEEMAAQRQAISAGIPRIDGGPQIASYDIREFVY